MKLNRNRKVKDNPMKMVRIETGDLQKFEMEQAGSIYLLDKIILIPDLLHEA